MNGVCELTGSALKEGTSADEVALMGKQSPTLHHAEHTPIQQPEKIAFSQHVCHLQSWTSPQGLQVVPTQSSFL